MNIAEAIVNRLLENDRVCTSCQGELGIKGDAGQSHGYCKRHALAMQKNILDGAIKSGKQRLIDLAQKRMAEIQATPDEQYPPDLARQHAAVAQ